MKIKELFGKEITCVFCVFGRYQGWLDTADCIIELDGDLLIGFPFAYQDDVWVRDLPENAERLFGPRHPNRVIGRRIVNFLWYEDDVDPAFLLLDDGTIITETRMSPQGAGQAGFNCYDSLADLIEMTGEGIKGYKNSVEMG